MASVPVLNDEASDPLSGRVLVIEAERRVAAMAVSALSAASYEVEAATDGAAGLTRATQWRPDVVVIDLSLPDTDGIDVCRSLRAAGVIAPVLLFAANRRQVQRIVCRAAGVDDYLAKPFAPRELTTRVQALLVRSQRTAPPTTKVDECRKHGPVTIDPAAREVSVGGANVPLTKTEYDILYLLTENPRRVITRGQLREHIWGQDWLADDHAVDVHVSNLRRKLAVAGGPAAIRTIRGVGYRMAYAA